MNGKELVAAPTLVRPDTVVCSDVTRLLRLPQLASPEDVQHVQTSLTTEPLFTPDCQRLSLTLRAG